MGRLVVLSVLMLLCIALPAPLIAGRLEDKGKAWLDTQKDPAEINVNGGWDSEEWGVLHLSQTKESREVRGSGGGYELTGVVSGKNLYLLFASSRGTVDYCAVLKSDSDNSLAGHYYYRVSRLKFGVGFCQKNGRPMYLTKK
jgi:hypothetical protein